MPRSAYIQPKAAWKVTLDGRDLTEKLAPRLISLRLSERRGEEADELEIVLHDSDGKAAIPPEGAVLRVLLGWERGSDVTVGLVDKGSFTVDEVTWGGPPDRLTIRARSADLKESFRTRRNKAWIATTIGAVVTEIAARHGLIARCHADLLQTAIAAAEQSNKSDMQFLRDLARRHDATATVKAGTLIFAPIEAATTATGATLPTATITRRQCSSYAWHRASRENAQDGVEAQWHDKDNATRKTATTGGTNRKRLKKIYATEADAKAAARAEAGRLKRATADLDLTLALGEPRLSPSMQIAASGFKAEIALQSWLVSSTTHRMDDRGLTTRASLETISR